MKNFCYLPVIFLLFSFVFFSCSKEDDRSVNPNSETAILSFGAVVNNLINNNPGVRQAIDDLPECSSETPATVEVILSHEGEYVVGVPGEPVSVPVNPNPHDYNDDGEEEYYTEESSYLELTPGDYVLEYFQVLDSGGNVIWASPRSSDIPGGFAGFINSPLPLDIRLGAGVKKYVPIEVICYDNRFVNEYGYLFFDIEGAEAIEFCVFGNVCDENGRHAPAKFRFDVWTYSGDPAAPRGVALYDELNPYTNIVGVNEDGDIYGEPVCLFLPNTDAEDIYYAEIYLIQNGTNTLIRSGQFTDEDVIGLFDGTDNLDYYHFREGCEGEDTPNILSSDVLPTEPPTCEPTNEIGPQEVQETPLSQGDLFASPNGSGDSCSQGSPCSLETAISHSNAGDVVFLEGGVYDIDIDGLRFNRSGQSGAPITYESYPGQVAVLDGSQVAEGNNTRVRVTGDWNVLRRIEIRNMPDVGLFIDGNYNLIDGIISHSNYYSGIQVFSPYSSFPYGEHGSFNIIQNSVTYNNFDEGGSSNGGDADGISISSGEGNQVLHNFVYDNSDDGIDVWRSTNSVVAYNIVANSGRANGNGNGIKAGGPEPSNGTLVHHNIAYNNRETGIDYNLGDNLNFFNNTSYNNSYGYSGDSEVTLKNNISFGNEREWVSSANNERNSWQEGFSVSSADFLSLDPQSSDFLRLAPESDLIDAGVDVGLCFAGTAPDLGALEYVGDEN